MDFGVLARMNTISQSFTRSVLEYQRSHSTSEADIGQVQPRIFSDVKPEGSAAAAPPIVSPAESKKIVKGLVKQGALDALHHVRGTRNLPASLLAVRVGLFGKTELTMPQMQHALAILRVIHDATPFRPAAPAVRRGGSSEGILQKVDRLNREIRELNTEAAAIIKR